MKIIISIDGRQGAQAAIEHGLEIAHQSEATVHALYVVDTRVSRSGPLLEPLRQQGREAVRDVGMAGAQASLDGITEIVEGIPPEEILKYPKYLGEYPVWRESVAQLEPARSGTFISVSAKISRMLDNVLVAVDGSPLSKRALRYALDTFSDAAITSIYVINPIDSVIDVEAGGLPVAEDWYENAQERASTIHTAATNLAAEHGTDLDTVTEIGRPATAILEYADNNDVDQIVIGSHGRSGIDRMLLGSVAETVTRRAQIPVTVVA